MQMWLLILQQQRIKKKKNLWHVVKHRNGERIQDLCFLKLFLEAFAFFQRKKNICPVLASSFCEHFGSVSLLGL